MSSLYPTGSHEQRVYEFYRHGVEAYGDFHGGYLNFGLWKGTEDTYLTAAEQLVHRMGDLLQLDSDSRLLDVACGMGPQDVYLSRHFAPYRIVGLDLLPEHLDHAERRIEAAGEQARVEFQRGTATSLPFDERTFTHVLCIEGLVHFKTRGQFFHEAFRVLEPGGRVAFADYAVRKEPQTPIERLLLRLVTRLWNIPFENAESPAQYQDCLENCGFRQVKVHCVGADVIPGYCREQSRPECLREVTRIRGFFAGRIGHLIDIVLDWAYRKGLVEYILVEGQKPSLLGS